MSRSLSLASLVLSLLPLASGAPLAFSDGEAFKFRVGWGIFPTAGELTVKAALEDNNGANFLRITSDTRTAGFIRALYTFDGHSECVFDARDGTLLTAFATTQAPKKQTNAIALFDYDSGKVRYEDRVNKERTFEAPLPEGNPLDMITTLINARTWDVKPGDVVPAVVMFDDEFYELTIHAERIEKVDTAFGEIDALVLSPKMEKNPRGMFKRGGQVHVWISQDERRLPVKLKVQLKFGTGTAYLVDYQPGLVAAQSDAVSAP